MDYQNEDKYGEDAVVKPNIVLGIIGALLGALVGSVAWVLIYQLGYIAAIAGLAIFWCSFQGYRILGKSTNMLAVVIVLLVSTIVLIGAHFLCWGLEIYSLLEISLMDAIFLIPSLVFNPVIIAEDSSIVLSFIRDLAIGLVVICVSAAPYFRKAAHQRRIKTEDFV